MFWLHKDYEETNSSHSSLIDNGACGEWTPFLTSLFDGEADAESALQARRHLIVCERCARAWFDWNQTRTLLQNQSAPPPPPSLLWRVRLACRLGQPQSQPHPHLATQILARTSRAPLNTSLQAQLSAALRGLRFQTSLAGAVALGAFVLLLSRDGFLSNSASLDPTQSRFASGASSLSRPQLSEDGSRFDSDKNDSDVLAPQIPSEQPLSTREISPARSAEDESSSENSLATLARARHERETLRSESVRSASYNLGEPLPMLKVARFKPVAFEPRRNESRRQLPPARLASFDDVTPRPIASAPLSVTPRSSGVMLASLSVSSAGTSSRLSRSSRVTSTSASGAPLRISAPHALPITVSSPTETDESDLDELNSTVQDYRATFADDSDFINDATE